MGEINRKHKRTLDKIIEKPERSDIPWKDIEALITALGGEISNLIYSSTLGVEFFATLSG